MSKSRTGSYNTQGENEVGLFHSSQAHCGHFPHIFHTQDPLPATQTTKALKK